MSTHRWINKPILPPIHIYLYTNAARFIDYLCKNCSLPSNPGPPGRYWNHMKPYHTKLNWLFIYFLPWNFLGFSAALSVWFSIEVGCELWASGRFTKDPNLRHSSWKNIIRIHDVVIKKMLDFSKLSLLWSNLFPLNVSRVGCHLLKQVQW